MKYDFGFTISDFGLLQGRTLVVAQFQGFIQLLWFMFHINDQIKSPSVTTNLFASYLSRGDE